MDEIQFIRKSQSKRRNREKSEKSRLERTKMED